MNADDSEVWGIDLLTGPPRSSSGSESTRSRVCEYRGLWSGGAGFGGFRVIMVGYAKTKSSVATVQ